MELAANDRLIVKNLLVPQVGFLGDASERAKDNTELLTLAAEMLYALKMIVLFDGSQEKDGRVRRSEEDDCTIAIQQIIANSCRNGTSLHSPAE